MIFIFTRRFFALFLCVVVMLSMGGCINNNTDDQTFIKHNILATSCENSQDGADVKINMKSIFSVFNLRSVSYTESFVSYNKVFLDHKDIIGLWLSVKSSIEFVINDEASIPYENYGHIYTIEFNDDELMTVSHINGYVYIQTDDHKYVSKTIVTESGLER